MRIVLLVPGSGHFHCGSCLRDDALAVGLRAAGHDAFLVPLYLPLVLESEGGPGAPLQLGGARLWLSHQTRLARWIPRWLTRFLDHPRLLRWASRRGGMTEARDLGPLTVATLEGEHGPAAEGLEELVAWLALGERPDAIVLSNAMLLGLAPQLAQSLDVPLICTLQGEAPFLDGLSEPWRARAWGAMRARVQHVDAFVPVSHHYGALMAERLELDASELRVVHNGIVLDDIAPGRADGAPTIGFLARMCRDKGLDVLVDAFLQLRRRMPELRLEVAGALLRSDEAFLAELQATLAAAGALEATRFSPNLNRPQKLEFLRRLSVLSVPATYGESFGLYVLEAMAAGVPVVQPRCGAFPELLEATGGGLLCDPHDPESLAEGLRQLLVDGEERRRLGELGRAAVQKGFSATRMADDFAAVCASLASESGPPRL